MTENDLQIGQFVEHASCSHADPLQSRLIMPAKAEGGQRGVGALVDSGIVGVAHRRQRGLRMDKERHAQFRRFSQHRAEGGMVEVPVARSTAQQRALQTKVTDRALKFARRGLGIEHGQRREPLEAIRIASAGLGDPIVYAVRQFDGDGGSQIMEPGRGE
ncbi:hypothetical protein QCD71_22075 [Sphingomonas sp. PsM26]|nr:hypothetical protein [Sphingomonas sp. PsM26]